MASYKVHVTSCHIGIMRFFREKYRKVNHVQNGIIWYGEPVFIMMRLNNIGFLFYHIGTHDIY